MRVALDATPLSLSSGGLARYASELIRALADNFPDDQFLLVSDQPFPMPEPAPANLERGAAPRGPAARRWWSWGLGRELSRRGVEAFHGTNFEVPYLPLRPAVLTLHDLSPWRDPGWQNGVGRVHKRTPAVIGMGLATLVITPTEAVRREAIEKLRIHPGRIVAVPEAASSRILPVSAPARPPYFLFAGTLEPRKNLPLLVEAWREVRHRVAVDLVVAGRRRSDFAPLAPEPGLEVLGEVSDDELSALYSGALAFLYPSLYEGFGLPVLEAMQCGAPVIASSDPAITEVAGGAALLLDARDARAWVEAMWAAAIRPDWAAAWRGRSRERAAEFSWARTARLTREVYQEALRRG